MENYFNELNKINVNDKTDKKGKFTYLSWAWAWGEVKKLHPNASYKIHKFGEDRKPYLLDSDMGYMVFTEVTINDITHEMWLPIMDFKNQAIPQGKATMMEVNKAIMRCLVKNIGMPGLGLYIYSGEDLPSEEDGNTKVDETKTYQQMVTSKFNELVTKFGTNTEVYKRIGKTKIDFLKDYKENPQMLLELLNGF